MSFAASKSKSYVRYWFLTVDEDVPELSETDPDYVADIIDQVLNDEKGWKRMGYFFEEISAEEGLYARKKKSNRKYVVHIHLSTDKTVEKACNFGGLSCADLKDNTVYFNLDKWLYGTKESRMSLEEYRQYLIQHEIGHILNRSHNKCTDNENDSCPVMYQQTISKGCCKPNPWPLDWE